jgi:hypothetical protein
VGQAITAALVALLTLGAPLAAALGCAGWKAAPDARMACCVKAAACPMRARAAGAGHASAVHLSQAEADTCCAASETGEAPPLASFAPAPLIATLPIVPDLGPPAAATRACPPDPAPPPAPAIARHLLLAVFLL